MHQTLTYFLSILMFAHSLFYNIIPAGMAKINLELEKEEAVFNFFDLSDGEALLIENWQGETILVNTGSEKAQSELKKRLDLYSIDTIDHLILTGSGDNYAGNMEWLIDNYSVHDLYTTAMIHHKKEIPLSFHEIKKDSELEIIAGLKIKMLYEPNDGAMTLSIQYGEHKLLYMGYANGRIERGLVENNDLDSDILKVSEFGSKEATSQYFLDHVDPDIAVLFKEKGERPSAQVMERLQESWIDTYLPYRFGLVVFKCNYDYYDVSKILVEDDK